MRTQALRADLMMLLTAIIWGSSFIAQRLGMDSIGPFLYTGLRFALASIALLPLIVWLERRIEHRKPESINPGLLRGGLKCWCFWRLIWRSNALTPKMNWGG